MASPPVAVEDEADEDFFDKLVDDEFDVKDSGGGDLAAVFPNLKIGDEGLVGESGISEDDPTDKLVQKNADLIANEDPVPDSEQSCFELGKKEENLIVGEGNKVPVNLVESSESSSCIAAAESSGSGAGRPAVGFKEVAWSSFYVDRNQQEEDAFGAATEFFSHIDDSSSIQDSSFNFGVVSNGVDQSISDSTAYHGLTGQQQNDYGVDQSISDSTAYHDLTGQQENDYSHGGASEQTSGGHSLSSNQHVEDLYPGWWYDSASGQWYQTDSAIADQDNLGGNGSRTEVEETASSITSDVSYLQKASEPVIQSVTENGTTTSVSNWNLGYEANTQYPPHMMFDPQYPDWLYDTISQNWCPLNSYTSPATIESSVITNQATATTTTSGGSSGELAQANKFLGQNHQDQTVNWNEPNKSAFTNTLGNSHGKFGQVNEFVEQDLSNQGPSSQGNISNWSSNKQDASESWGGSASYFSHQNWHAESVSANGALNTGNDEGFNLHGSNSSSSKVYAWNNVGTGFNDYGGSHNMYTINQSNITHNNMPQISTHYYGNQNSFAYPQQEFHAPYASFGKTNYSPGEGRSSAGRPPHALVSFGFGGKLIVMKNEAYATGTVYGSQPPGASVSVLNLSEVVMDKNDLLHTGSGSLDYFRALCQQSIPGPLNANVAAKEVNKWLDDRIANSGSMSADLRKAELIKLILSLLKISCQQYGKLRSPFGADSSSQDTDGPEAAITKLFASAKHSTRQLSYGAINHCIQNLPSEAQIRASAVEVQNLLVSGRRKEALLRAQESQLWGPALILASQLGPQFYADTVKQMAHRQFLPGSPLRTLCLLIAGEPGDAFSGGASAVSSQSNIPFPSQPLQTNLTGMLDDWEENLAIITANRTKDDELVIINLGDLLWKERDEIMAAHICYLVAESNFEPYSNSARLCLVGADHLKYPRTYATPEAIQRTEIYEYSQFLGNSQYILLLFQPYKIIYAYMLAEVGKITDSLRYCQAIVKTLKNPGRSPEIESWKSLVSSLEERIRTHQQGGYSTNLAAGNLVGKIFNTIDKSLFRKNGTPAAGPAPPVSAVHNFVPDNPNFVPKVQSSMAMSTMIPSASMEPIGAWAGDNNRMPFPNRSISEPDFASPKEVTHQSGDSGSGKKKSVSGGPSRIGRIGSQIFQKTIGWVSKHGPGQAKLGDDNKFYYDENLKTWVEEGVAPSAEAALPPPPPKAASFQQNTTDYNISNAFKEQSPPAHDSNPPTLSSGIPPIPPSANQFSARSRMGVRSRYVDTFNKGGGTPTNLFHSPSLPIPAPKPMTAAKFFVPTPAASSDPSFAYPIVESIQDQPPIHQDIPTADVNEPSSTFKALSPSIQRFQSLDNITYNQNYASPQMSNGSMGAHSRAASWSGASYPQVFNNQHNQNDPKPSFAPSRFTPSGSTFMPSAPSFTSGGSSGDDLQDVDL